MGRGESSKASANGLLFGPRKSVTMEVQETENGISIVRFGECSGDKIAAIKMVRKQLGLPLSEAASLVARQDIIALATNEAQVLQRDLFGVCDVDIKSISMTEQAKRDALHPHQGLALVEVQCVSDKRIAFIKVHRSFTNVGLKQAKNLMEDSVPKPQTLFLPESEAREYVRQMLAYDHYAAASVPLAKPYTRKITLGNFYDKEKALELLSSFFQTDANMILKEPNASWQEEIGDPLAVMSLFREHGIELDIEIRGY